MGSPNHQTTKPPNSSVLSYQEHFLKVSSQSNEPNSRCLKNGILWDQIWPNLDLNDVNARVRTGKHITKLFSVNSFVIKNISWKFHRNLMNQIRDIFKGQILASNMTLFGPKWWACPGKYGKHTTKLISLNYFYIKNISSKFHRNNDQPNSRYLKTYFGTKYVLIRA